MIKQLFILFLLIGLNTTCFAQYKSTKLKMAEGLLEEGKYFAALKIYEDISKSQGDNKDVYLKIAELHEQLFNYEEAAKWYYELFEIQAGEYPKSEFKFAELIMMQGKYEVALEHFESFNKTYRGHDKALYTNLCKAYIKSCKTAMESLPNAEISIKRIPKNVNSAYTDLAPFGHEGKLYFSAIPTDTALTYTEYLDSAPTFQIFEATQIEDEQFDSAKVFLPEIINEPYRHTSNGAFNPKGDQFFFTRCKQNINGKNICKIYCTTKNDTSWNEPILLGGEINDRKNDFSSTHPAIMEYKKRGRKGETITKLVFASSMPGGEGGYDLWMVNIDKELDVDKPENLGNKINSSQNEVTPFYSSKDQKLYFSSNGNGGLGGLDVFETPVKNGKTKKISPLDQPINSSWDDWYYNQMSSSTAFIVSNRKGAKTYYNNIRLDDIFLIKKETKKYLSLFAYDKDSADLLIKGSLFKVKFANDTKSEGMQVETGKPFQVIPNKTYEIIAQKNGYFNQSTLFSTSYDTKSDTLKWDFKLEKIDTLKPTVIDNIYFDSDAITLKPESKQTLNKLYQFLIVNPSLRIEISGHTDSQGSKEHNLKLSQQRAQTVVDYLVEKGIGKDVLTAKGYGDSKPVADNSKPELNRRIEYKVIDLNNIDDQQPK